MTTSIFYPSLYGTLAQPGDGNGTAARSLARELTQAATIAERVFASGSGSTTMTSGTFTNTPTSGDVLLAVIGRRADGQTTITNPTGWTKLTGASTTGSRLLEVWWYRSTGVVGDKGSFSWTVTSATGAWGIELIRIGGSGAYADPTLKTAATAFTATTTPAAVTEAPGAGAEAPGMSLTCISITGASLGASGITAAFSGTGTAESTTSYYDSTYGAMAVSINDLYNNASYGSATFGTAYTLSASRAGHQAVIHLDGGGTAVTTGGGLGAGVNYNSGASLPGGLMQSYAIWDTSSIPDNNTVSSATLGLRALATSVASLYSTTDPANATLQARYYGTSITDTRANDNNHWAMSPTGISAKTLVATYPAASAWTAGTDYTLTSTGSFPGVINKTGNTVLVFTTDDYASATARATRETYGFDVTSTFAPLTVVHSFAGTASAAATAGLTPTITRKIGFARTVSITLGLTPTIQRVKGTTASLVASLTATPVIARALGTSRTIVASLTTTPTISRLVAASRTLTATLTTTPTIARQAALKVTVASSTTLTPIVNRTAAYARTLTTTITTVPALAIARGVTRTINATTGLIATIIAGRFVAQPPRILRLAMRSSIKVGQTVTARLRGRSTIRLPKETR